MFELSPSQEEFLSGITNEITCEPDQREKIFSILKDGYQRFTTPEIMERYKGSFESLVNTTHLWLLESKDKIDRTSEEAFLSESGQREIRNILISLNVHTSELDDLSQDMTFKFYRYKSAEKYNPLMAPWNYYIKRLVRTCVATFSVRRKRNLLARAFNYQQYDAIKRNTSDGT